ncbi:hypothetical protein [Sorangium sp. So ce233]
MTKRRLERSEGYLPSCSTIKGTNGSTMDGRGATTFGSTPA